jgi:hypothetical protein
MKNKTKKYFGSIAVAMALTCLCGAHCELYQKISGPRQPAQLQPAPAGTVTIGGKGDENISSIQETADKGFIIGAEGEIIKTDSGGNVLFTKTMSELPFLLPGETMIRETSDNRYLIIAKDAVARNDQYDFKVNIVKTDAAFSVVWEKNFNCIGWYVRECDNCGGIFKLNTTFSFTQDQGVVIFGANDSSGQKISDAWICRLNSAGDTVFFNPKISTTGNYFGANVKNLVDGSLVVSTFANTVYLMKSDNMGNLLWQKQFLPTFASRNILIFSIENLSDNNIAIAGGTNLASDAPHDVFIIRTDPEGNMIWSRTYLGRQGGISDAYARSILPVTNGEFVVLGVTTATVSETESDVWFFKVNANGDTVWSHAYGGQNSDFGKVLSPLQNGGFILGAYTYSFGSGGSDIWLIKTDTNGNIVPLK